MRGGGRGIAWMIKASNVQQIIVVAEYGIQDLFQDFDANFVYVSNNVFCFGRTSR